MRSAGILLPVFSLPGKYGIGGFGREAYNFVDFLADCGQKYWQVLPLNPTSYGDSPYQSPSVYAGNPYFIDLDGLRGDGLLTAGECRAAETDSAAIDYSRLYETWYKLLRAAYSRFNPAAYTEEAGTTREGAAKSGVQTGNSCRAAEGVYADVLDRGGKANVARINAAICPLTAKIGGSAQVLHGDDVLFHGTLLVDSDLNFLGKVLKPDYEKLARHAIKSVVSRVTNLKTLFKKPYTALEVMDLLLAEFSAADGAARYAFTAADKKAIEKLSRDKYSIEEWNYNGIEVKIINDKL